MRQTSRADGDGESGERDRVSPTARWLVHGAWRIAVGTIIVLLVLNLIFELTD
jgi:hypothetical protein